MLTADGAGGQRTFKHHSNHNISHICPCKVGRLDIEASQASGCSLMAPLAAMEFIEEEEFILDVVRM